MNSPPSQPSPVAETLAAATIFADPATLSWHDHPGSTWNRLALASNGGDDTVIGTPRPQDVFGHDRFGHELLGRSDGIDALTGGGGLAPELGRLTADDGLDAFVLQAMLDLSSHAIGRTMIETPLDQQPLEMAAEAAPLQPGQDAFGDDLITLHDGRIVAAEVDYLLG